MKKTLILSMLLAISLVSFSAPKTADTSRMREENGITYYFNEDTPFTGKVIDKKDRNYYTDGKPDGKWVTFFPNGALKSIENWKNGKLNGKYVIYQENGLKVMQTSYINGNDNGEYFLYHENGNLQVQGYFKNGIPIGTWKYYHPDGKLKGKAIYPD